MRVRLSKKARLKVAAEVIAETPNGTLEEHRRETLLRIAGLEAALLDRKREQAARWARDNPESNRAWVESNRAQKRKHCREFNNRNRNRIRAYVLATKYGLTHEDVANMLAAQGGRCAICGGDSPRGKGSWHVDHCHATNSVRGLLCQPCNQGLGLFRDNPDTLEKAATYLRR